MAGGISLNANMRSNLLSLQNISGQVSLTQNRLATGLKVNSAIDNPSSFYTAKSLNNRATDLSTLLDSMEQAVSTVKAANTALEAGSELLAHAAALANSTLDTTVIPSFQDMQALVGDSGTVVTTAQELKNAVNSGVKTICVYGKINYFENETLKLKNGQKLVGTEYFTGYTGNEKFSKINFKGNQNNAIECRENTISDLALNFDCTSTTICNLIFKNGNAKLNISNLDLNLSSLDATSQNLQGAIYAYYGELAIDGTININGTGARGGVTTFECHTTISKDAVVNIKNTSSRYENYSFMMYRNSVVDLYGTINCNGRTFFGYKEYDNNTLNIYNGATINTAKGFLIDASNSDDTRNKISFEAGSRLNINDGYGLVSTISTGTSILSSTTSFIIIISKDLMTTPGFSKTSNPTDWNNFPPVNKRTANNTDKAAKGYKKLINQYDELMNDASYKGINLLKGNDLSVMFNEDRSSSLTVDGADMTSSSLGLTTFDWQTQGDIAQSLAEIADALSSIRSFTTELGNNYSILTTRQNFTDSLINVLTEGADNLTLADMNSESATMLALQTRQQLAVNALSLASESAREILKLF